MSAPNSIPEEHLANVCKRGQGEACCRYAALTPGTGYTCEKFTDLGPYLNQRLAAGQLRSKGDNCPGLPDPH